MFFFSDEFFPTPAPLSHFQDGVHSLQYRVKKVVVESLYTLIKVDLQKENEKDFGIKL